MIIPVLYVYSNLRYIESTPTTATKSPPTPSSISKLYEIISEPPVSVTAAHVTDTLVGPVLVASDTGPADGLAATPANS